MVANKQKKSTFSMFNVFKARRPRRSEDTRDDNTAAIGLKIWPSDEDRGSWVGDPRIDRKASAFIAKFHATQVSASELQLHAHTVNFQTS